MFHRTNILILGGFLGSGKTTVLLELARYVAAHSEKKTPVAILENEIGEVDVDGATVESGGYSVKSLFAGCACCELLGQLPSAVEGIIEEFDPDLLIVEATGVAVPSSMACALRPLTDRLRTCVLVDAARWQRIRLPLERLLRSQLCDADIILVNKCDLAAASEIDDVVQNALEYAGCEKPVVLVSAQNGIGDEDAATILGKE